MSLGRLLSAAFIDSEPAVQILAQSVDAGYLTAGRLWGGAAALLGLAGAIVGGMALARARRGTGNGGRNGAFVALVAGLIALASGALNLLVADGGPGTGNGVVGGGMALVLGLLAAILGGLAATRAHRAS